MWAVTVVSTMNPLRGSAGLELTVARLLPTSMVSNSLSAFFVIEWSFNVERPQLSLHMRWSYESKVMSCYIVWSILECVCNELTPHRQQPVCTSVYCFRKCRKKGSLCWPLTAQRINQETSCSPALRLARPTASVEGAI